MRWLRRLCTQTLDPTAHLLPIDVSRPARLFPEARKLKRKVFLHIGPTNSGKSFTAFQSFKRAQHGFYAGPLRMLAREICDKMHAENLPCNLVTGDEIQEETDPATGKLVGRSSGTVEMLDISQHLDVAVIDEIQMISDPDRGWAWTRAFLGARAREIHLCGDPNAHDIVKTLVSQMGDDLEVRRYDRLGPLEVDKAEILPNTFLKALEPGDCVVCFSKKDVRSLRDRIMQSKNRRCAIIYGSLPPETRAEQARLFNTPGSGVDYMVASDAIGMGLNLAIRRVIFASVKKFDGEKINKLSVPHIKQIAGRAGRYGVASGKGLVNCANVKDKLLIRKALKSKSPMIKHAVYMPPTNVVRAATLDTHDALFSRTLQRVFDAAVIGKHYARPRKGTATDVAALCDDISGLTLEDRLRLVNAPVAMGGEAEDAFRTMCSVIGSGESRNVVEIEPRIVEVLGARTVPTISLEGIHKVITLFLWLSYRFPCNFVDRQGATDLKRLCEHRLNSVLASRRFLSSRPKKLKARL